MFLCIRLNVTFSKKNKIKQSHLLWTEIIIILFTPIHIHSIQDIVINEIYQMPAGLSMSKNVLITAAHL